MSALLKAPREARLEPFTMERLPAVCAIEQSAYSHPWTAANFTDSMAAGCHCQCLIGPVAKQGWAGLGRRGEALIGYFVAMKGVDEVHLLNITVAPAFQGQGWARLMLDALAGWSRGQNMQWLWLEVRAGNQRALSVYERHGFQRVGLRKNYYPTLGGGHEDAVLMSLCLHESANGG